LEALKKPHVELVRVDATQNIVSVLNGELANRMYSLIVVGVGQEMGNEDAVDYLLESLPADFLLFVRQDTDADHDVV